MNICDLLADYKNQCICWSANKKLENNMLRIFAVAVLLLFFQNLCTATALKSSWEYEFLETYANYTDAERVFVQLDMERISRGVYGLTGVFDTKVPMADDYTIYIYALRSTSGTGDWKKLPYEVPKQSVVKFFQTTYRNIAMESLKDCTNFPQLDEDWEGPLEAKKYDINKCILEKDKLPNYLPEGYYQVHILVEGSASAYVYVLAKVQSVV